MRVLFLTHRLPYAPNRGDRIRAYHVLNALRKRARVDLVSLVHDQEEESHAADLRECASSVTTIPVSRLTGVVRALGALKRGTPMTHALLDAPGIRSLLEGIVAAQRPDVVLAYCSGMARFALEPPLASLPFVLDMVDVDSAKWAALAGRTGGLRRWIYNREASRLAPFERLAAARSHAAVVVNDRERSTLARLAPTARAVTVPNGIDLDFFRPQGPPEASAQVVFCGVFNYKPNEEGASWFVHEVWPRVVEKRRDARLTLVGSCPTRALQRMSARDASIRLTGSVPDVRPYLWQSAVAIAPIWTAHGVQNKVLEAVAAGLPSVITPAVHDGLPAEVDPACTVAPTPESFAASVLTLLESAPAARRAAAERADLHALAWERQLEPLFDLLESAASSARQPLQRPDPVARTA